MVNEMSSEAARAVSESNLVKDVANRFGADLARFGRLEKEMLGTLAARIEILESMESAAKEKMKQLEGCDIHLAMQVRSDCPELPENLREVLANLEKIAAVPGAMSDVDFAFFDALKEKIPAFIEKISKKSTVESDSEGNPKSLLFAPESSVTTSMPSGVSDISDEVCSVSSSYSSSSTSFSGYETAASKAPYPSWENTIVIPSSAAVESTQMDASFSF